MNTQKPASDELALNTHALLQTVGDAAISGKLASLTLIAVTNDGGVIETSLNSHNLPLSALHLGLLSAHHHRFAATYLSIDQNAKARVAQTAKPILNANGKPVSQ